MTFLSNDLTRNFGIGFGVGTLAVVLAKFDGIIGAVPKLVASLF